MINRATSKYYAPPRPCLWCGALFRPYVYNVKNGQGKFCTRKCAHQHKTDGLTNKLDTDAFRERFWSRCCKNGPVPQHQLHLGACWTWKGATNSDGYGHIAIRGKVQSVHRIAWIITNGAPGPLSVLHSCDNPCCCNPAHLFLGTHADNMQDMARKGRCDNAGSKNGRALVSEADVLDIRNEAHAGESNAAIARKRDVSANMISKIVRGKTWKHIGGPIRSPI